MVTILITVEAYESIKATLPKGAETWAAHLGGYRITLDRKTVDRLVALRGRGESYSDVILRLAKGSAA